MPLQPPKQHVTQTDVYIDSPEFKEAGSPYALANILTDPDRYPTTAVIGAIDEVDMLKQLHPKLVEGKGLDMLADDVLQNTLQLKQVPSRKQLTIHKDAVAKPKIPHAPSFFQMKYIPDKPRNYNIEYGTYRGVPIAKSSAAYYKDDGHIFIPLNYITKQSKETLKKAIGHENDHWLVDSGWFDNQEVTDD